MTEPTQDFAQLTLTGDCTIYEVADLSLQLGELLRQAPSITLDLASVERVDASFLQLLVALHKEADRTSTQLHLRNPTDDVKVLIESLHVDLPLELPAGSADAGAQ